MIQKDTTQNKKAFKTDDLVPALHASTKDFIAVDTQQIEWQAAPMKGVWRKRLMVIPGEPSQLTTLVKFEAGCSFDHHGHPFGEELLILSGVFSDDSGNFNKGSYVRNPDGYHHAPWTNEGCELLVMLCQFQGDDKECKHIQTSKSKPELKAKGLYVTQLHDKDNEHIALYQLDARSAFNTAVFKHQMLELFIIKGDLVSQGITYPTGTWIRTPQHYLTDITSNKGGQFYFKASLHPFM